MPTQWSRPGALIQRGCAIVTAVVLVLALTPGPAAANPSETSKAAATLADRSSIAESAVPLGGPTTDDALNRQITQDLVDYDEDEEVRDAAKEALATNDPQEIADFLDKGLPVARAAADKRRKELADRNRALVTAWSKDAGPIARQRAAAALATGDDAKIGDFVAVGKAVADAADAKTAQDAVELAKKIKARVEQMVAMGGYEVRTAGQAALDSADPLVIAEFYNKGYEEARQRDADAQKKIDDALAQRAKAISDLTDLAVRSTQAGTARKRIITASVDAAKALTLASMSMGLAARDAKQGDTIYAQDKPIRNAGGKTHTSDLAKLSVSAKGNAADTARYAGVVAAHAGVAETAAQQLVETGLTHGVDWAEVIGAQSAAGQAASHAADTARHAADATEAASRALDADKNATVDAGNAVKYRQAAEREQAAAEKLAVTAAKLAASAQAAERDARAQRLRAEQAEKDAWRHADNAETHYRRAVTQRNIARQAMATAVAESYAANAAARRAVVQQNIVLGKAEHAQTLTNQALNLGVKFNEMAGKAKDLTKNAQKAATNAKGKEYEAEVAEAKLLAAIGTNQEGAARLAATTTKRYAIEARGASDTAQGDAKQAAGAASAAGTAARQAAQAAAAARAEAAAARREAELAHQAATEAAAAANKAINDAQTASADARAAINAARAAVSHAAAAKSDAELTLAAAQSAAYEAGMASFQARVAGRSALGARISASAIASPAATAIDIAGAYSDTDNDAALAEDIATTAMAMGVLHSASAQKHAEEAEQAAKHAETEAAKAAEQVKPAYEAARRAAAAAAKAIRSSQIAIDAAIAANRDASAAVTAATSAANADKKAGGFAAGAERMATEASNDAAVARQAYNAARSYANIAATAARSADKLADLTMHMASVTEKIAAAITPIAAKLTEWANTLEGYVDAVYDAEERAKQRSWFKWLNDQAAKLRDIPFYGHMYHGEADALIGMGEGLWTLGLCAFGGSEPAGRSTSSIPSSEDACTAIEDGFKAIWNHPGILVHSDEWSKDWQYALGLTLVDIVSLALPGIGKVAEAIGSTVSLTGALAKLLSESLAAGIVKFGNASIKIAIEKLGAVNAGKLLGLTMTMPIRLTFKRLEIRAIGLSIELRGFDAVEQILRDAGDSTPLDGLKKRAITDCIGNSFTAETPVLLEDGTHRPIHEIRAGDRVLATDPDTGQTGGETVSVTHRNRDTELAHVTIATATDPSETVRTTQHHRFWNAASHQWIDATDLRPGDSLHTPHGDIANVVAVRRYTGEQIMHDLTVARLHTYYVLAGSTPVLVHNANCGDFYDFYDSGAGIAATLDKDGILDTVIISPEGHVPSGGQMFINAMEALGKDAKGVRGKWLSEGGELTDNLDSFNAGIQVGLSEVDAALNTFTGKMAVRYGFTKVRFEMRDGSPGEYTKIQVVFAR